MLNNITSNTHGLLSKTSYYATCQMFQCLPCVLGIFFLFFLSIDIITSNIQRIKYEIPGGCQFHWIDKVGCQFHWIDTVGCKNIDANNSECKPSIVVRYIVERYIVERYIV